MNRWSTRWRRQRERPDLRRSLHPAAGRGYRNPNVNGWYDFTPTTAVSSASTGNRTFSSIGRRAPGTWRGHRPQLQLLREPAGPGPPGVGVVGGGRHRAGPQPRRYPVGDEPDRGAGHPLRSRPIEPDDHDDDPSPQLYPYSQPVVTVRTASRFLPRGHYENYKELIDGRADAPRDRYVPFPYDGNADFTVLSFRTTNVLRWEFKPGSTMFVVWQQGREGFRPESGFRFGARLRRHLQHAVGERLPGEAVVLDQPMSSLA